MNYKQKTLSRIKKCFLFEIYKDIISTICFIVGVIFIPLTLAYIFTPSLLTEAEYFITWLFWTAGIVMSIGIILMIYGLIYTWLDSRWEKAKERAEKEIKKDKKNGRTRKKPL